MANALHMLCAMKCRIHLHNAALTLATMLAGLLPLAGQAGGLPENVVQAEIREGWMTKDGTRMAALHLTLTPGWKTYWRAPGEAGIPPVFNWSGSENLQGVSYHWPSPEVFTNYGLRSVGYKDELILPIELHPKNAGTPIRLKGEVDLGVCETICMPAHLKVDAWLEGPGHSDPEIHTALANQPRSASRAGVRNVKCDLSPISDGLRLSARIEMPRLQGEEVAMVEAGDPRIWVSEPEVQRQGNALAVQADLVPPNGKPMALSRSALRFTVIGTTNSVDIRGCTTN
ncbi:protein-disulfide reductase DsbD domain-containing protein [Aliiruegeria lutimaris]|uniref:Disulphide bond corrector protein DsbC n=1 Tax=Aliiruegeria lutimaris TaxID=571298 RepID=A0A1G8XHF7_9RHOB|nr:protein-disulfide reductase DsbD domain-containing protein [Aliiruegeria lutimaris]SDJ89375.1 Disulphide bond corrector protein DsbC [Aliiruegeria lutimaris]